MTTWLPVETVARLLPQQPTPRHVRRLASQGHFGEVRRDGRMLMIDSDRLPDEARAVLTLGHIDLLPVPTNPPFESPLYSFDDATPTQKLRASQRLGALADYDAFFTEWGERRGISKARRRWVENYVARHPELVISVSVTSLQRWRAQYESMGKDGLVDGNDGHARRGKSVIPERVRSAFIARKTDGTDPSVAQVIEELRVFFGAMGVDLSHIADDAFRRIEIPEALERMTGRDQDKRERVDFTLRRRHDFPALKIVVADHHLTDRWVHCGEGSYVIVGDRLVTVPPAQICEGECRHGHRVWITAFMDVASRAVLSTVVALEYPNADTVRRALRQLILKYGLPELIYVDNGKDFKSAFGKAVRRGEALPMPENILGNLLASLGIRVIFAIPRRARSKSIERLFGTWCRQIWQGHPEYVGALGKRTEAAHELYKKPHLLLSLGQFTGELDLQIDLYNLREGHRGQGMNGRSPLEVFDTTRIARRDPETNGFAIAFWTWYGRQVMPGGTLVVGADRYVLDPMVTATALGKKVQLLVNPEDVKRAIVLTGCAHTDSRTSRTKSLTCDCAGKGNLLCEATLDALGVYDDPQVTAEHLREAARITKEIRRTALRYRAPEAIRDLAAFTRNRGALLTAIRDRKRKAHEERMVAVVGGVPQPVTTMLPQSRIAKRLEEYRAEMYAPRLSAEKLAKASEVEDFTDDYLDAIERGPRLVHADEVEEDELALAAEKDRVRAAAERRRKEREEECLDCTAPVWAGSYCMDHHRFSD